MLEEIIREQQQIIDQLLEISQKRKKGVDQKQKEFICKAPTGSGKTYMQAYLMERLLKKYPDCVIFYQSLSRGSLAQQGYETIQNYNFANINSFLLTSETSKQENLVIPLGYNVYFLPQDLYKKSSRLNVPFEKFVVWTLKNKTKFLIIDECHISHKNIDKLNGQFTKIYGFSATPTKEQLEKCCVELSDDYCVNLKLIKAKKIVENNNILFSNSFNISEMENYVEKKLMNALNHFEEIKQKYKGSGVNPALIIQISNASKTKTNFGEIQKRKIIELLDKKGILWYYRDESGYDSSDKIAELKNKNPKKAWQYVKNNHSNIDVIIFKLAINVGVDIPRACYLLQIRQTQSETLDEQVVGRVRRNPKLKEWDSLSEEFKNNLMVAYIDGVEQQGTKKVNFVKRKTDISIEVTKLNNKCPESLNKKIAEIEGLNLKCNTDIFKLKEYWNQLDGKIKNSIKQKYKINKRQWINFCLSVKALNKTNFNNNYTRKIYVAGKVGLPKVTFYRWDTLYTTDIKKWNWVNYDLIKDKPTNDVYAFESEAEKMIASELAQKKLTIWGKNFFNKSKISFEFFLREKGLYYVANQYPDFFVVNNNKIYLIEVKSFYGLHDETYVNANDYKDKVECIKNVYREIANITNQIMVLIEREEDDSWISYVYERGKELKTYHNSEKLKFLD